MFIKDYDEEKHILELDKGTIILKPEVYVIKYRWDGYTDANSMWVSYEVEPYYVIGTDYSNEFEVRQPYELTDEQLDKLKTEFSYIESKPEHVEGYFVVDVEERLGNMVVYIGHDPNYIGEDWHKRADNAEIVGNNYIDEVWNYRCKGDYHYVLLDEYVYGLSHTCIFTKLAMKQGLFASGVLVKRENDGYIVDEDTYGIRYGMPVKELLDIIEKVEAKE